MIRPVRMDDASALCAIYNHYVLNTVVSFEEERVSNEDFAVRIARVQQAALPWLVVEQNGSICGYACASRWQERSAYRFCALISVYLAPHCVGKGLGTQLYDALFVALRATPIRWVIGGIALPNAASVALHEKMGMARVGVHPQVGFKFGRWIDVGYWQGEVERRVGREPEPESGSRVP
ncbi:MAG: N-acetyltransferase family protein [Pseudomonadota bacterium]|nr:N-acetyltransferase family protein [Pseudomonadota bacterium]